MPFWLNLSIWTIYVLGVLFVVLAAIGQHIHNSNMLLVYQKGKMQFKNSTTAFTVGLILFTPFWIFWNIFG